ncbi:MAG TPA: cytochrome c biogenesis protein CcsA [Actinomycetota bacterium]|nr:cytochrome c biogenesis protein CcsA [Actinomycetota bacterium]
MTIAKTFLAWLDRSQESIVRNLSLLVPLGGLIGLGAIFFWVPTDAKQGVVQRIFYIHVPAALVAYVAFGMVLLGSIAYLKTHNRRWDSFAHASAEVGVLFTGACIVAGMLWGRPEWGTYWAWDPRLTTTFVMLMIYVGYLLFRAMATDPTRGARLAAVIGIVGFVNVPLVHYSVDWWNGLHPNMRLINFNGPQSLPWQMMVTFAYMVAVFAGLFILLMMLRMRLENAQIALAEAEEAEAEAAHPASPAVRSGPAASPSPMGATQ